jgi:hypothetical protein
MGVMFLAVFAFGVAFVIFLAALLVVFTHTSVPLVVIGVFRARGHRSRASRVLTIVLGVVWGLNMVVILGVIAFFVWSGTATYPTWKSGLVYALERVDDERPESGVVEVERDLRGDVVAGRFA